MHTVLLFAVLNGCNRFKKNYKRLFFAAPNYSLGGRRMQNSSFDNEGCRPLL